MLLVVYLCVTSSLSLATASTAEGQQLADLLESEAAQSRTSPPPYALLRAFSDATKVKVEEAVSLTSNANDLLTPGISFGERLGGVMDRERTVVGKGLGSSVDVCFRFHTRYFFRPDNATSVTPSALQLWPYFYQYEAFLEKVPEQTYTQTHTGVLDIDSAAFSLLNEARAFCEIELVLLAYNDWDAHAEEALAALAAFTQAHSSAFYRSDGLSAVTSSRVRTCGQRGISGLASESVVAVKRDGFDWIATSTAPQGSIDVRAKYATLNVRRDGAAVESALQVIGSARMAAFSTYRSHPSRMFRRLHRSASPRLYFFTSQNMGTMDLDRSATSGTPPSVVAQQGFSSADVHRFVHQHSRSSFLLASQQAYLVALQLHKRILVLVGHPAMLPGGWWASLVESSHTHTAVLQALRREIPFFLSESEDPIPAIPSSAQDNRRCVLPTRRIEVGNEVRAVYSRDKLDAQLKSLRWGREVLHLRLVQQRAGGGGSNSCQWVQLIELPYPTADTDAAFYDVAVMGAVTEWVRRASKGDDDWVTRLGTTAHLSLQLDYLLQPTVSYVSRLPPPALVMAVEAADDCTSALQRLRLHERELAVGRGDAGVAAAAYATLSARLTTAQEELSLAAQVVPLSALSTLFPHFPSSPTSFAEWAALAGRCPLFVVMRNTTDIFRVAENGGSTAATAAAATTSSPASLEAIEDDALAAALLDLHRELSINTETAAVHDEHMAEVHSRYYTTPQHGHHWRVVLPTGIEVPVVVYDFAEAAQSLLTSALPASEPTFILLLQTECGVCSNYAKAFEFLRHTYRRAGGGDRRQEEVGDTEQARFVLVDLSTGFNASRIDTLQLHDAPSSRAHWLRARHTLLPHYITNVKALKVPQLLLVNGTNVLTTLPTEAYAERWQWPHALLRLMALVDAAVDVAATKTAMWDLLEARRREKDVLRGPA
jgi:hypothetical protein